MVRQFTMRGHDLLAVERFQDGTRHMVEFEVLKDGSLLALRGETARLFLSEDSYQRRSGARRWEKFASPATPLWWRAT